MYSTVSCSLNTIFLTSLLPWSTSISATSHLVVLKLYRSPCAWSSCNQSSLPPFLAPLLRGYNPLIGLDVLCVQPISKAQAWQRCGRAGREGPGKCYRLYTEETFQVQCVCVCVCMCVCVCVCVHVCVCVCVVFMHCVRMWMGEGRTSCEFRKMCFFL